MLFRSPAPARDAKGSRKSAARVAIRRRETRGKRNQSPSPTSLLRRPSAPPARVTHVVCCADVRARREQLLRHLHVTVPGSQVQRRVTVLPPGPARSAPPTAPPARLAPCSSRQKAKKHSSPSPTSLLQSPSARVAHVVCRVDVRAPPRAASPPTPSDRSLQPSAVAWIRPPARGPRGQRPRLHRPHRFPSTSRAGRSPKNRRRCSRAGAVIATPQSAKSVPV